MPLDQLDGQGAAGQHAAAPAERRRRLFYAGFGANVNARYAASLRIDGSGLAGSTDLFFGDLFVMNFRIFADPQPARGTQLIEDVLAARRTRGQDLRGTTTQFDARAREIVDKSTGARPAAWWPPFGVDPGPGGTSRPGLRGLFGSTGRIGLRAGAFYLRLTDPHPAGTCCILLAPNASTRRARLSPPQAQATRPRGRGGGERRGGGARCGPCQAQAAMRNARWRRALAVGSALAEEPWPISPGRRAAAGCSARSPRRAGMDIVTTNTKAEALPLEAQLIKRFRRPYKRAAARR